MLRIITHIERLLLVHDCVIVPRFGGFVLQSVSAVQDVEGHTFRPSRKEIGFNVTLQHNDGLLSESYMQMYEANYRNAQSMLEEDIEEMKTSLQQDKKLSLGVLGSFNVGEEGQIIFFPGETGLFSISSYGLPVFDYPALALAPAEREADTLYIPVSRRLVRTAVASVAAVALFLLISTPVTDVNQDAYTASFIPTEMVSYKAASPTVALLPETDVLEVAPAVVPAGKKDEVSAIRSKEVAPTTVDVPEVRNNAKMYHIVIASFPSEAQADAYISDVDKRECKHVNKVSRGGKYRIYADRFDNREEAEVYMAILRKNSKYADAWLFISR